MVERKKLLDERVSDTFYMKINNIFFEEINKPKVFIPTTSFLTIKNTNKTVEIVVAQIDTTVLGATTIWNRVKKELTPEEFELYKKIFVGINGTDHILHEFKLRLAPKEVRPEAGGDMSSKGVMTLYLQDWVSDIKPNEKEISRDETAQKLMYKLREGNFLTRFRRIFVHEFAHYINAVRTKDPRYADTRVNARSKGGSNQFDVSKKEYAQSTEELQARLSEIYDLIYNLLTLQSTQGLDVAQKTILYMFAINDKKTFINYFSKFGTMAHNKHLVDKNFQKKMINRLYSAFESLYNLNTPLLQVIKKNPELVKPSSFEIFNRWMDTQLSAFDRKLDSIEASVKKFFTNTFSRKER